MRPTSRYPEGTFDITAQTAAMRSPAKRLPYGAYAWLMLGCCVLPVVVGLALTPGVGRRRQLARWGARAFFFLIGGRLRTSGAAIPPERCVVVANHASYLDGIILTAALPANFTFVIKQEMVRIPVAAFLLRRLGSEFVDRTDRRHRNQVAKRLLSAARAGDALAFFPEGTFGDSAGLRPFRPGAFAAAWRGRMPVVPVVISGTRRMLPARQWLPAPSALSVHVCEPLEPDRFGSARELLQASRQAILAHLKEPDLDAEEPPTAAPEPLADGP